MRHPIPGSRGPNVRLRAHPLEVRINPHVNQVLSVDDAMTREAGGDAQLGECSVAELATSAAKIEQHLLLIMA